MLGVMSESEPKPASQAPEPRIRLIIDTEDVIRQAVRLRALKRRCTASDVVNEVLRREFAEEIEDLQPKEPDPAPKRRR